MAATQIAVNETQCEIARQHPQLSWQRQWLIQIRERVSQRAAAACAPVMVMMMLMRHA